MFFFGCVAPFTSDESPFSRRCRGFHENPFWSVFQFCDGHKTPHVSLVIVSVRCLGFFPLSLQKKGRVTSEPPKCTISLEETIEKDVSFCHERGSKPKQKR